MINQNHRSKSSIKIINDNYYYFLLLLILLLNNLILIYSLYFNVNILFHHFSLINMVTKINDAIKT